MKKMLFGFVGMFLVVGLFVGGCRKPYDVPEYKEVKNNETGFLVPLEGDTTKQAQLKSIDFLKTNQVSTKRVQILHRWNQTGRWEATGEWIPAWKLITVDRTPVTSEWTADANTGTAKKDQAIWVESKDSVGFSTGFTCTAYVAEEDAATYLYYYPEKSLQSVVDTEIRGSVQAIAAEVSAKYDMDVLREKKQEIIDSIRFGRPVVESKLSVERPASQPSKVLLALQPIYNKGERANGDVVAEGVVAFFKRRGITITTVGMFGGMTYENKDIQKSIDGVFIAQQKKNTNKALLEAQEDENKRILSESENMAKAAKQKATGEADALREVAKAAAEAQSNPVFLQLKLIEVQQKQIEKWNGSYPIYFMGMGNAGGTLPNLLVQMPTPATQPSR